jgi:hypothetical protein
MPQALRRAHSGPGGVGCSVVETLHSPSPVPKLQGYRGVYGTLYNQFAGVVFSYSPLEEDVIS